MLAQELLDVGLPMLGRMTRWCCDMQKRRRDSCSLATPLLRSYSPPAGSCIPRMCRSRRHMVVKLRSTRRSGGHIELP
ncbi:hypothetical protein PS1_030487 [Malus domestica]